MKLCPEAEASYQEMIRFRTTNVKAKEALAGMERAPCERNFKALCDADPYIHGWASYRRPPVASSEVR
jgi:hypothetical protein